MDLRAAVHDLAEEVQHVLGRLRTAEADTVSRADLHVLEVQIYLLDKQLKRLKALKPVKETRPPIIFPPFTPDQDKK